MMTSRRLPVDFPRLSPEYVRAMLEPPSGRIRLVIDTDTANEIDDQFALAWALLTPEKFEIEAVTAEPFSFQHHGPEIVAMEKALDLRGAMEPGQEKLVGGFQGWVNRLHKQGRRASDLRFTTPEEGVELSYQEILRVFDKLDIATNGRVHRGSPGYLKSYDEPYRNDSVDAIIDLAKSGKTPLYIAALGCLTNIASAMLLAPEIINNIVVVWTSSYPSSSPHNNQPSLNLVQDRLASQLLFDCGVAHVYLPGYQVGARLLVSLPEIEAFVKGRGKIGDYLHHLYVNNPLHDMFALDDTPRRTWVMWDMINIAWLMNPEWVPTYMTTSPILGDDLYWHQRPDGHPMREAHDVQRDELFLSFYDKLKAAP